MQRSCKLTIFTARYFANYYFIIIHTESKVSYTSGVPHRSHHFQLIYLTWLKLFAFLHVLHVLTPCWVDTVGAMSIFNIEKINLEIIFYNCKIFITY